MSYTTLGFWLLLAIAIAGVVWLPNRLRVLWLLAVSLWFYAAPDPMRLLWLGGVATLVLAGLRLGQLGRPWAGRSAAIVALVALLVWGKFADTVGLPDPNAPPGLSFYTFTAIAVLVETTRRGKTWRMQDVAFHLAWFPKVLAGPIERPQTLIPQLSGIALRPAAATLGLSWLLAGLVKKLVIADSLAPMVDAAYAIPNYAPPTELLLASYFFAFQIYCDFSGYADIAMGLSLLVGLRLSRNFAHPYLAPTVSAFWSSHWHITLGQWFRDFVYIPLGGSRRGPLRKAVNLMVVFLISGVWHAGLGYGVGWGFLIWGAINGAVVLVETLLPTPKRRVSRVLRTVLTFHVILITWVFFRAATPGDAVTILRRIGAALPDLPSQLSHYPFGAGHIWALVLIGALLATEIVTADKPLAERLTRAPLPLRWGGWYAAMTLLLIAGHWQGAGFIYAGF